MKTSPTKNAFLNRKKLSLWKITKYLGFVFGTLILICLLVFILFTDPLINKFLKVPITNAFTEAYPEYSLQLGEMHYDIWKNRLGSDSIILKRNDSTFTSSAVSFSVSGISWMKILWQRGITLNNLTRTVIDAQNIILSFHKSQEGLKFGMLHISVPNSELTADSIKYFPLINDEQFFAKSKFKQTRFRFDIPQINISGLDYLALLKGNTYKARSINVKDVSADILVNMDSPDDSNSTNPLMPNEALLSMKEIVKVDSLKIINGQLKYCEKFTVGGTPGVITFNKVNVSISGIANHSDNPDTSIIHANGIFMDSGTMKLFVEIPLNSKDFNLRYSGSLDTMDVTKLNTFIEPAEHQRIKSGTIHSAEYKINVNSGYASGMLQVEYEDLSIALLDKKTGSEKGVFNQILSIIGKAFVIRGNNVPDEKGKMKIGEIKYTRDPKDTFLQFLWYALRGGVSDVVGIPRD
jgi:hypothetical protein